jgi:tripartite-type tricarboxylate transporter receptor subunit TctC
MPYRVARRGLLALGASLGCAPLLAQDAYPSRRIEIIVPFPAGGTADFLGRLVGQKLTEAWGQQVVINNKPGAAGALGAEAAAQAAPDGYTLLITSYTNLRMLFTPEAPVADPARELVPVALLTKPPLVLLAHPSLPAKTVRELITLAKQKNDMNYASIGAGTPSHLAMELFMRTAGIPLTHVPYKGSSQALADVVAGHVPLMFDSVVSSSPHINAGRLRALAVSSTARLAALPDVPTVAEAGFSNFDVSTWAVLYTPAGTPPDRIARLHDAVNRILRQPDLAERYAAQGAPLPPPLTPAQTAAFVREDVGMWRKLVREAGIQPE